MLVYIHNKNHQKIISNHNTIKQRLHYFTVSLFAQTNTEKLQNQLSSFINRDRKKVNTDKDRQIYYGMFIIGGYEVNKKILTYR